ncbi:UNVERIFIED_CONTAM: hypothetical protein NCL1_30471 [Trichonephila clavipes]
MFLREYDAKEQNTSVDQEKSYIDKMPSSCNTEQAIIFPYIGPPGTGPGLLGSKPGSDKLEYLTALEHHPHLHMNNVQDYRICIALAITNLVALQCISLHANLFVGQSSV